MKITSYLFLSVCIFAAPFLYADDFNPFGDGAADGGKSGAANFGISIGGEISAGTTFYFEDIKNGADSILPGNLVKGRLDFSAKGDFAEAFISLKVEPDFAASNLNIKTLFPVYADEMYASFYYNAQGRTAFILSAGLRKLNWGKADSDGPLDVINPHDYSDLSEVTDYAGIKIARPLVHAVWNAGDFIKVEGVLVPWFAGHTFADNGRWKPKNISKLEDGLAEIKKQLANLGQPFAGLSGDINTTIQKPDGASLSYFQAGARASATIDGADMALQYYYGYLPRPAVEVKLAPAAPSIPVGASLVYNRFHQAGADFAAVIAGFNLRAEAAFNITEDTEGSDPSVYNPFFHWSLGFDRAFAGFDLNLQCAEKISLAPPVPDLETDIEAEIPSTLTRVTARVSRVFFRDALTLKFTTLWDIEDSAALLVPSVTLKKGDIEFEISCGIFAGRGNGELGQYRDNGFAKALVTWVF